MANGELTSSAPPATSPEGSAGRVIGAIINPAATFESVVKRPTWLLPLVLLIAVSVSVVYSFGHRVGWRGLFEKQLATNSRFQAMSPQQQKQIIDRQVRFAPVGGYAGATIVTVVFVLAVAGILLGAFNVIFGTTIRFKQALGITTHSFLPTVIRGLIGLVVIWVRPQEGINLQNLVMSSAGAFLSSSAPNWLRTLASSFDLFTFWVIALLAVGFTAAGASRKLKIGSSLAIIGGLYLVWVLCMTGFVAMFA